MALIRWQRPEMNVWSPFRHLSTLRDEIDRLFDSPLNALTNDSQQFLNGWLPTLDLHEDKDHLVLKAELPGMKKEDIDISLHGDVLTLSGERKEEENYEKAETYRAERFLGRFQRTLTLPFAVNASKVQASYKDGILTVTLPKAEEAKPKQIQVKVD
ncbi:MAG TPA: Hsp20/alpha crystallin family protein [Methylomirabilota bacterium]|nr:Hsp20/alpha crystallin family protein [Methylomirabilota bacterium]